MRGKREKGDRPSHLREGRLRFLKKSERKESVEEGKAGKIEAVVLEKKKKVFQIQGERGKKILRWPEVQRALLEGMERFCGKEGRSSASLTSWGVSSTGKEGGERDYPKRGGQGTKKRRKEPYLREVNSVHSPPQMKYDEKEGSAHQEV